MIACAGPFSVHGEPVLEAAVDTATHYLDTTGEQTWMRTAFEDYGPRAHSAGTTVIPAMGFDYVPGDMIAALTAQGMGEVDEVVLAYSVAGFGMTRGTQLSGLEMVGGGDVEWRKLKWMPADQSVGRGTYLFPEPIGRQRMVRYPAGEQITVPRHVATRQVRTMITASTLAPSPARPGVAGSHPVDRPGDADPAAKGRGQDDQPPARGPRARGPPGGSVHDRLRRDPRGRRPPRRDPRFRRLRHDGRLPSRRGAIIAARGGISATGALAPSQAFEPAEFLTSLDRFDISWDVQESERAAGRARDGLDAARARQRRDAVGHPGGGRDARRPALPSMRRAALRLVRGPRASAPAPDQIIDRCENCGLVVGRDSVPDAEGALDELLALRTGARSNGPAPGRRSP